MLECVGERKCGLRFHALPRLGASGAEQQGIGPAASTRPVGSGFRVMSTPVYGADGNAVDM